jgi:hypothetical protein
MDDLKFPVFDKPLPPPKKVSFETYVAYVLECLNRMGWEKVRQATAKRPIPTGARFKLE